MTDNLDRISVGVPDYTEPTVLGEPPDADERMTWEEPEAELYAPEGMSLRETSYGVIPAL